MKARFTLPMASLLLILTSGPLLADEGKALFEKSCTKCHGAEVFTSNDRSITSLEGLKSRVKKCSVAADSQWTEDQFNSVVEYLNRDFYKFDATSSK